MDCKSAPFKFKAGIGYDFLSQKYFLDSLSQAGVDSFFTHFSLTNKYLDDMRGIFHVTYSPRDDRSLEISSRYEQTADFLRLRLLSDIRSNIKKSKLYFSSEFDWRHLYGDTSQLGNSYIFGYSKLKLISPLSKSVKSIMQIQGEFVDFQSVSNFNYNYYRGGGKIGLEKMFGYFSFGDIKLTFSGRQVPDSAQLNYVSYGLENSFFGFYNSGQIDFFSSIENRDYNALNYLNDYFRMMFIGHHKLNLGKSFFLGQDIDYEYLNYNSLDPINRDYFQLGFTFLAGYQNLDYRVAAGPALKFQKEEKEEYIEGQDYSEIGGKIEFDIIKVNKIFTSIESVTGYRNLKYNNDIQTDFTFERINILSDFKIYNGLNINLIFSAEWEWHEISSNNSQIYLLSSSFTYNY